MAKKLKHKRKALGKNHKQSWFLFSFGLPIRIVRIHARAQRKCLRCLREPQYRGTRCKACWLEREQDNKTRKR